MNGVRYTTRHRSTSPLPVVSVSATAEKGRSAVARMLTIILMIFPMFAVFATNANPASADFGLPISLPFTLAQANAVVEGAEAITLASATTLAEATAIVGGAAAVTASAPIDLTAAAAFAGSAAIYYAWKWKPGHNPSYAQQTATAGQANGYWSSTSGSCQWYSASSGWQYSGCANPTFVFDPNVYGSYANDQVRMDAFPQKNAVPPDSEAKVEVYYANSSNRPDLMRLACYLSPGPSSGQTNNLDIPINLVSNGWATASTSGLATSCRYGVANAFITRQVSPDSGAIYYVPGGANTPGNGANATPALSTTPTRTCSDGSTVTGTVAHYDGLSGGDTLPVLQFPACPAGTSTTGISAPTKRDSDGATVEPPIKPWNPPTIPSAFPECNPAGRCTLVLTQVSPEGNTIVCNGNTLCDGWSQLPLQAPSRTVWDIGTGTQVTTLVPTDAGGRTYRCNWGPYELKASECSTVPTNVGTGTVTGANPQGCFNGMGISPLTWPTGLIISPLKCLFIPSGDAMSRWKTQVDGIKTTGVFATVTTFTNFMSSVATTGKTSYACPSEAAGTFDDGKTVVTKTSPIHWCDILVKAGDQTQGTTWGMVIYNGARIMLCLWFAFLWYNRISASTGSTVTV